MTENLDSSSGMQSQRGYVLDAENAAEMARLMLMDHLLTQAMGGPLPEQPHPEQLHQVLDIACGPGGWLFDLMTRYPHMQGVGIDISQLMIEYATNLAYTQGLSNIQFRVMDATQQLSLSDSTFDLVNARILTGFLSTIQWSTLLAECARITRPRGVLRLTEGEWGFTNSAALDRLQHLSERALHQSGRSFSPGGRTIGTAAVLPLLMREAGYQDIKCQAHVVNYSAGTEAHESNCQNMLVFHKLYQPFLAQMHVASQEELEQLLSQMEEEMQAETFCAIDFFLTAWGRKA
ncbi:MAG: methyltransferase domain-containing protein [Ktedonobacteraceae bacterium]|nr:methyltransferase domain-containing protein [Ktedonobacteraceae bacterium]